MQRSNINHGAFTLMVSLCGGYWAAPGSVYIRNKVRAEAVAKMYAGRMTNA